MILNSVESERPERASVPATDADLADPNVPAADPMLYCPLCSTRLDARKCKLICAGCGYYMSRRLHLSSLSNTKSTDSRHVNLATSQRWVVPW